MTETISAFFEHREEIPLFYVESGSRLWGIASPDSDYDLRGFHLPSKRQYYDFKKHRNLIEVMDGDFDFVSYDLDKMFGLLAKSNPTVFEWIRAHIVYFNELPNWAMLQHDIIVNFDFRALFHHYINMAKGQLHLMETSKKFTYKSAFYCIRGLLSAELASKQVIPELLIEQLFLQFPRNNEVLQIARDSLERKKQHTEKEKVPAPDQKAMLAAIKAYASQLESQAPGNSHNRQKLELILTEYSFSLKSAVYGS
jgi:predicted nucleotidyltransferase